MSCSAAGPGKALRGDPAPGRKASLQAWPGLEKGVQNDVGRGGTLGQAASEPLLPRVPDSLYLYIVIVIVSSPRTRIKRAISLPRRVPLVGRQQLGPHYG